MKAAELRGLADDQLLDQIATTRRELFGLRFSNVSGELENSSSIGTTKKDLARALTVANERGLDPNQKKKANG